MPVRKGATLVEVLVAIFVMGIGMIALLVLFPLGALRMAQAIQDSNTAVMRQNGQAMLNIAFNNTNIPNDQNVMVPLAGAQPLYVQGWPINAVPPYVYSWTNPATGPSYPVLIDPLGFLSAPPVSQKWVAGVPGTIPRANLSWIATSNVQRWFGALDDILFDSNGYPKYQTVIAPPNASTFDRDIRYSMAYLCQRPRSTDSTVVDVATIVFNRRPLSISQSLTLSENVYDNSVFDVSRNLVTVTWDPVGSNPPRPPVQLGDWILDATPMNTGLAPAPGVAPYATSGYATAHGNFYRIVNLTDLPPNQIQFEVQTALQGFTNSQIPQIAGQPNQYLGRVIVLEGVVEVFDCAPPRSP